MIRSASTNAADDRVVVLKDGQSFTEPREERGALDMHGASPQPGMLLLDGATNGSHWWTVLETAPGGCWDGDPGAGDAYRVWDLGSTILFTDGLELPKAQGFNASKPSHMTHGHLGWDYWDARRFCVNERGEVTYADSDWR